MAPPTDNRGPGRPAASQASDVRAALIDAGRECIVEVGFAAASTKDIARRAGVNPAMINYYFGSKAAFGETVFRETLEPLRQSLNAIEKRRSGFSLLEFLRTYMSTLARYPWILRIVVREVLPENGHFRDIYFKEFANRGAALLPAAMVSAQEKGFVSSELDPRFAVMSLVSLAAFPILTASILGANLGVDFSDEETFEEFLEHTRKLLIRGLDGTKEVE